MGSGSSSSHQLRTQGLDRNGTTLVARLQFFGAGWKMVLLDPLQKLLECGPAGIWPGLSFPPSITCGELTSDRATDTACFTAGQLSRAGISWTPD